MSVNITDVKVRISETSGQTQWASLFFTQYGLTDIDFTLSASNWSGSSAPYTQTVSNLTGVTSATEGVVSVAQGISTTAYKAASEAYIRCTSQGSGSLTFGAYGTKPTVDIPMHLGNIHVPVE